MSHLRSVLPYYRPYRRGLALGLGLVVLAQAFSLVVPGWPAMKAWIGS